MRTSKPCPGCGEVDHSRPADKVCAECAAAIASWNQHIARVKVDSDKVAVSIRSCYHWYPMFYFGEHGTSNELGELRTGLAKLFAELGERICGELLKWPATADLNPERLYSDPRVRRASHGYPEGELISYPTSNGDGSSGESVGMADRRTVEILRALWDHTARFAHAAYLNGVAEGRNLLLQLSTGAMSPQRFQEDDLNLARKTQDAKYLHQEMKKRRRK